jgi:hypothetical protein
MKKLANHSNLYPFRLFTFLIVLLLLLFTACTPPAQDNGAPLETDSVQTEENEVADSPVLPTDTAGPDMPTPTPSATATPLPTLTSTPGPYAMITGNTNCRTGPGSVYDLLHTYLAGDEAQLLGKSQDGFFWYTSNQGGIAPDCWLWGQYATPVGDTAPLPVFTPPPTPTPSPDFEITYVYADVAVGSWYLFFEIENTGSVAWESALIYTYEPTVPQDSGRFSNVFQVNGTSPTPTMDSIPAGGTGYFHAARLANPGAYGEVGDVVDIYFVACTEEYLGGFCISKMWTESIW